MVLDPVPQIAARGFWETAQEPRSAAFDPICEGTQANTANRGPRAIERGTRATGQRVGLLWARLAGNRRGSRAIGPARRERPAADGSRWTDRGPRIDGR